MDSDQIRIIEEEDGENKEDYMSEDEIENQTIQNEPYEEMGQSRKCRMHGDGKDHATSGILIRIAGST